MKSLSSKILPIGMLFASILLLWIGIPRFLAELMLVPGTPIYDRLAAGETITPEELDVLQQSREQAIGFVDHPKAYYELGYLYNFRAQGASDVAQRGIYAQQAIDYLTKGLALAPVAATAWSKLAVAYILAGPENNKKAVEAWRTSVALANFDPFLFLPRNHVGVSLYSAMTEEDKSILRDQLLLTYNWNRGRMRTHARDQGLMEWMVFLLHDDPEKADWFKVK